MHRLKALSFRNFKARLWPQEVNMRCPFCNESETKVIDSRSMQEGFSIRRRRKCEACNRRFTTYENVEINMPMVFKLDGRREPYQREKIKNGLSKACQKRPISTAQIENLIDNVEKNILEISEKEVASKDIGKIITMYLRNLDPVAYIRFASVYRKFQDVDEFVNDIKHEEEEFGNISH